LDGIVTLDVGASVFLVPTDLSCPKLEYLDLSGTIVSDDELVSTCSKAENLKVLVLNDCHLLRGSCFEILFEEKKALKFLRKLDISKCNGMKIIDRDRRLRIASTSLKYLGIGRTRFTSISVDCPNLEKLDISGCSNLTEMCLLSMLQGMPKLGFLWMRDNTALTELVIRKLPIFCPKIRAIEMSGISRPELTLALFEVVPHCKLLYRIYNNAPPENARERELAEQFLKAFPNIMVTNKFRVANIEL